MTQYNIILYYDIYKLFLIDKRYWIMLLGLVARPDSIAGPNADGSN
jgi:hypothetical protein